MDVASLGWTWTTSGLRLLVILNFAVKASDAAAVSEHHATAGLAAHQSAFVNINLRRLHEEEGQQRVVASAANSKRNDDYDLVNTSRVNVTLIDASFIDLAGGTRADSDDGGRACVDEGAMRGETPEVAGANASDAHADTLYKNGSDTLAKSNVTQAETQRISLAPQVGTVEETQHQASNAHAELPGESPTVSSGVHAETQEKTQVKTSVSAEGTDDSARSMHAQRREETKFRFTPAGMPEMTLSTVAPQAQECIDDNKGFGATCAYYKHDCGTMAMRKYCKLACGLCERQLQERFKRKLNRPGDLRAFILASVVFASATLVTFWVFTELRQKYQHVYLSSIRNGTPPVAEVPEGRWGWVRASLSFSIEDVAEDVTLDAAMFIEFIRLCIGILRELFCPIVFILAPLHLLCGGNAAGDDKLSRTGLGNVQYGSGLFILHAFFVWFVVITIEGAVHKAMLRFIQLRHFWIQMLPPSQARTVLVTNIPDEYRSDSELRKFFCQVFPSDQVVSAFVVKDTAVLMDLQRQRDEEMAKILETQRRGEYVVTLTMRNTLEGLNRQIEQERVKVLKQAAMNVAGINCAAGFVTFAQRSTAEMALDMRFHEGDDDMAIMPAPDATGLRWDHLKKTAFQTQAGTIIGYGLLVVVFFAFIPTVIFLGHVAEEVSLGPLQFVWRALCPTIGLNLVMHVLPACIMWIVGRCLYLESDSHTQVITYSMYFWLQVLFVIFLYSIGTSLLHFVLEVVQSPPSLLFVTADTLPYESHFFMNFMVSQCASHAVPLLRLDVLFASFRHLVHHPQPADAAKLSEPEGQAWNGIGVRASRITLIFAVGLIYCLICPPLVVLTIIALFLCQIVYGFLLPYAENKKTDLGGAIFVRQLDDILGVSAIFCFLMTGVLYIRADGAIPSYIAGAGFLRAIWSWHKFARSHFWRRLPFAKVLKCEKRDTAEDANADESVKTAYIQPELLPPTWGTARKAIVRAASNLT
eukprot:TRINITY_DN33081_c0_g1_i1.p1 TRINITY_DN33081_c0_g1~~TRINITY_DN33081_c0_g1_i1.p1  ORF type:complete len:982 (-),score=173.62 TRINITY_DN33081_c0_g1_i1:88-3033(-)